MANPAPAVAEQILSQVTLKRVTYKLNDFVFLKPETDNECFYVGRIAEFLADEKAPLVPVKIKVAWFSRPKDVLGGSRRKHFDPRLLVATMNTDINPISAIIRKCDIKHMSHIQNMDTYKSLEDTFYYNQLYDRHTRRLYDVIPIESAKNLPLRILRHLASFQFILVEAGNADSFITKRICQSCSGWCRPEEPIASCGKCTKIFHLDCLGMTKKPPKGYTWQCSSCLKALGINSKEAINDVDPDDPSEDMDDNSTPTSCKAAVPIDFDADDGKEDDIPRVHDHNPLFPFCYFGEHASINDLDDEKAHPKSSSRIGKGFQADIPDWCDPSASTDEARPVVFVDDSPQQSVFPFRRRGRQRQSKTDIIIDRSCTNELVYCGDTLFEASIDVDKYVHQLYEMAATTHLHGDIIYSCILQLFQHRSDLEHSADWLGELVSRSHSMKWPDGDIKAFEKGVAKYGHELSWVRKEFLPKRTLKEIVLYFYIWKKTPRYYPVYSQYCLIYRPKKILKGADLRCSSIANGMDLSDFSSEEDDESQKPKPPGSWTECANCFNNVTVTRPAGLLSAHGQQQYWCIDCHTYFITYATSRVIADTVKKANRDREKKRKAGEFVEEGAPTPKKRGRPPGRTRTAPKSDSEPRRSIVEEDISFVETCVCAVCLDTAETKASWIVRCTGCKITVHTLCYGISAESPGDITQFRCDRCVNSSSPDASLIYDCVLCTDAFSHSISPIKRTAGSNWAHVQCAIWHAEPTFENTSSMEPIECIGLIDRKRWQEVCMICNVPKGACVICDEPGCTAACHVTCAQYCDSWVASIYFSAARTSGEPRLSPVIFCPLHIRKNFLNLPQLESLHTTSEGHSISENLRQYVLDGKSSNSDPKTRCQKRAFSRNLSGLCLCHGSGGTTQRTSISEGYTVLATADVAPVLPPPETILHTGDDVSNSSSLQLARKAVDSSHTSIPGSEIEHCRKCGTNISPFGFAWMT
ncbi:hypothetical protein BASA62_009762 [Batrachochytrium salamandrivorans]|nr:hypothetical protein BASA62_009762 [Batrachochytrium salamandrivorans]